VQFVLINTFRPPGDSEAFTIGRTCCSALDAIGTHSSVRRPGCWPRFPMATMGEPARALFLLPRTSSRRLRPGGGTDWRWQPLQLNIMRDHVRRPCFAILGTVRRVEAAVGSLIQRHIAAAISMPTAIHGDGETDPRTGTGSACASGDDNELLGVPDPETIQGQHDRRRTNGKGSRFFCCST